jgi:hypothetical protein
LLIGNGRKTQKADERADGKIKREGRAHIRVVNHRMYYNAY